MTPDLAERVTIDPLFNMPNLTALTTKTLQLESLFSVRHHASKFFNELVKQKDQMTVLIRSINPSYNKSSSLLISTVNETSEEGEALEILYFH